MCLKTMWSRLVVMNRAHKPANRLKKRKILVLQLCTQLAYVTSFGWWKSDLPSPLHQPKLATWTSGDQSCDFVCDTSTTQQK